MTATAKTTPTPDLAPSLPSRVVTIDTTDITEGVPGRGTVTFSLPVDLHVPADGMIVQQTERTVTLSEGKGAIRLPVYTNSITTRDGSTDWVVLVRKSWDQDGPYAIRVPDGDGPVSLASIANVRPLTQVERAYAISSVSLQVTSGALGGYATADGGQLGIHLSIPTATDATINGLGWVNVRDYGAKGDGSTDDAAAFKAALSAAGPGGRVYVPKSAGAYVIGSTLTFDNGQSIIGSGHANDANYNGTRLQYTGTGSCLNFPRGCGAIEGLLLTGPGSDAVGTVAITCKLTSGPTITEVCIQRFETGIMMDSCWYANLQHPMIQQCRTAIRVSYCYNVQLFNPRIAGWLDAGSTTPGGDGIVMDRKSLVYLHGGSIEQTRYGVQMIGGQQQVASMGTYFESKFVGGSCYRVEGGDNVLSIHGNLCYVHEYLAFMDAYAGTVQLTSFGNKFAGTRDTGTSFTAYRWNAGSGGVQRWFIWGDNWASVASDDLVRYCSDTIPGGSSITRPYGVQPVGGVAMPDAEQTAKTIYSTAAFSKPIPSTASRPSLINNAHHIGVSVYDTNLGKPIWWTGTKWVDGAGNPA